jgi:RHS repeat-associated protein
VSFSNYDNGTYNYIYDVENRLVGSSQAGTPVLYYDPLGRLYRSDVTGGGGTVSTRYQYDGADLVAEYAGEVLAARYIHGAGAGDDPLVAYIGAGTEQSDLRHLYADRLGSIILTSTRDGATQQISAYDEYGVRDAGNEGAGAGGAGRFAYTGQIWLPELKMYHYKARMYSPSLGRFMQTDPVGYGDGMNMYAYVGNDPVNGVDPTGLAWVWNCTYVGEGPGNCGWGHDGVNAGGFGFGGGAAPSVIPPAPYTCEVAAIFQMYQAGCSSPQEFPPVPVPAEGGHDYSVYGTICSKPLNAAEMTDILSRFSLPGHPGEIASNGDYTVYQWGIPGGRVRVRFGGDGLSVRNTTLNPHVFAGQIDRHIYSDRFGTFITTRGTGTAEFLGGARDWANEKLGPGIFEDLNEDAAAYAKKKYSGC